ncbi:MAG: OmpW family outer membrane protein [Crocinitomicaceae bacterium]
MKKTIIGAIAAFGIMFSNTASAQALEEGNLVFDVYYGFPNLYTTVFKAAYTQGTEEGLSISGIGPVGFRAEYLLADKIGLGLDIGFNNTKVSYTETGLIEDYTYDFSTKKIGVLLTFNYHFIDNDQVDFYGVFGVGYGNRTFSFESSDPSYTQAEISSLIPIAARIGVGVRYFLTDNLGINVAAGFGQGGILNAGLSVKI